MNENSLINEIKESEFDEKVLQASTASLVLVDFWAPWCGPCKQLTPLLEKVIKASKGKAKLIKINIDENQQIAAQMRIQSIPAVFAFKDGKPVDAFQGVIPEKKIIEFIEKSLGEKIEEDFTDFYNSIDDLLLNKDFEKAKEILENFIADNPNEFKAYSIYIDCLGHLKLYEEVKKFSESLDKDLLSNSLIKSSLQKITIKKENDSGPSLENLLEEFNKNPKKIENIIKLAEKYFAEDKIDDAMNLLLSNYKINNEKIKLKLIEFFEALGNENLKTAEYRKKLSSLIFS